MPFLIFLDFIKGFFARDAKKLVWNQARFVAWSVFVLASLTLLYTSLMAMLDSVSANFPSEVAMVWGWVMPTNARACLVTILSAKILRIVYDFKVQMATRKLQAVRL